MGEVLRHCRHDGTGSPSLHGVDMRFTAARMDPVLPTRTSFIIVKRPLSAQITRKPREGSDYQVEKVFAICPLEGGVLRFDRASAGYSTSGWTRFGLPEA